ncbi:Swt1 family HEPN domain-containing protein [Gordonia sp. CPCC 205515]|uniref:Swt1 family HEPN domain-containing protein n=1 Tax=Gordonia sp. CPCC 205515 TaxID=3140791 RepID=UPI003AF37B08
MALSNRDRINRAMELLGPALNRFISSVIDADLPNGTWLDLLRAKDQGKGASSNKTYNPDDPANGLRMVTENVTGSIRKGWYPIGDKLSRVHQSYASELREARNRLAHMDSFDNDDAQRTLDTCERFLKAINAPTEAEQVRAMRVDLRRVAADREDTQAARKLDLASVGGENLPPWREILSPHPDVASDNFNAAEFAADLYTVAEGKDAGEYSDPVQFFERTYLTQGLRDLVDRNVRRMTGDMNASPVVNLQTNFGGGKTHSMLALWHLASGRPSTSYTDEVAAIARSLDDLPASVRRVALVGNQMEPSKVSTVGGRPGIRTIWGELAWQLGGQEAYEIVADADRTSTNPGASLRELFELYAPAVILIDEWVAYARQLVNVSGLPAGDFDTQFTFAQTLTEAAKATKGIQVVISIPASYDNRPDQDEINDEEVGGENGRAALARLKSIVGRTADHWLPANPQESFEIVRRRIFVAPDGTTLAKISSIAKTLVEYYRKHGAEFPSEALEPAYIDRIKQSYPIHPELFDRLYEDWSTLDRFQRTRGVLRMMNQIVGTLWRSDDAGPLILPSSVPLDKDSVITEISQYLDDNWRPILNTDVAGADSVPYAIDKDHDLFGKRRVTQRLARAVFMGATPTLHTAHKGVDKPRIFLGTAVPGDVPGNFHSALDHLANRATYLYTDAARYWYDSQANTTRAARDHAAGLPKADVWAEVEHRLDEVRRASHDASFVGVHVCPGSSADVPDEAATRLVVVPMEHTHAARTANSAAMAWSRDVLEHRGTSHRGFKNSLVFLAADEKRARELDEAVREFLAWRYVHQNADPLGLGGQQTKQAESRMVKADNVVADRLVDTFIWTIMPVQASDAATYSLDTLNTGGTTDDIIERTGKKLRDNSLLATTRSSALINMDLTGPLASAWMSGRISVGDLYGLYATYPYLTRLRDRDALIDGLLSVFNDTTWTTNGFAFADAWDADKERYVGLVLPGDDGNPRLADSALIVKSDVAQEQRAAEIADINPPEPQPPTPGPTLVPTLTPGPTPSPDRRATRYWGSTTLDTDFPARDFATIQQEILQYLSVAAGTTVEVRIEITATTPDGFDESTQRTVRENANTLGFDESGFEVE